LAFHASRIIIDVGVLLAMASMSMTFITADSGNRSALDADALPAILLLLPIFVVTLIPDQARPLPRIVAWAALALGLAALPYAIIKVLDASILAETLDGTLAFGSRLLVIGCGVTLVGIGIGLYRALRGLPSGGTPGRTSRFRTRSKKLTAPGSQTESGSPPSPQLADVPPSPDASALSDSSPEPEPARAIPSGQPEIVFPDTGAVAREAEPDSMPADPLLDTAEQADAAIDDHFDSMFDPDNDRGSTSS